MGTQFIDTSPLFHCEDIRSYIARKLWKEFTDHPEKKITLDGKKYSEWNARLLAALEVEWERIRSEFT